MSPTSRDCDDFQLYLVFIGLKSGCLDVCVFDVEAPVAWTTPENSEFSGRRLVRRSGTTPGARTQTELHMSDLANDDGYKLRHWFVDVKEYDLLANHRCESLTRRPKQTLQYFFATEYIYIYSIVGTVKSGVSIDAHRRAHHIVTRSGRSNNQIAHENGFLFDHDAPSVDPVRCSPEGSTTSSEIWSFQPKFTRLSPLTSALSRFETSDRHMMVSGAPCRTHAIHTNYG